MASVKLLFVLLTRALAVSWPGVPYMSDEKQEISGQDELNYSRTLQSVNDLFHSSDFMHKSR